ncbi:MAG: hypothetical protein QM831_28905 [Kofleriaceae bacterium]
MRKLTIAPVLVVPFLACGGDDGNGSKVKVPDAKVFKDAAGGGSGSCEAADSYSSFVSQSVTDHPGSGGADGHYQLVRGVLAMNSNNTQDDWFAELDAGSNGSDLFPTGLVPGTYSFDSSTNGNVLEALIALEPQLGSDDVDGSGFLTDEYIENHFYLAFAATVTLNTEGGSGQTVSGSFSNLQMVHTQITLSGSGAITGISGYDDSGSGASCEVDIAALPFSATAKAGRQINPQPDANTTVTTKLAAHPEQMTLRNRHFADFRATR